MEKRNRLYLVRHGQVVGYENVPVTGHSDVDITDEGVRQMEVIADRLAEKNIDAIYSSDLQRSTKGANIIGKYHDVIVNVVSGFRELWFGDWEGMAFEDILEKYPKEVEDRKSSPVHFRAPGSTESVADLAKRVMDCAKTVFMEHKGNNIALVAHGMVNRVILCNALGLDLKNMIHIHQDYGCLNIIDYYPDHTLVRLVNG